MKFAMWDMLYYLVIVLALAVAIIVGGFAVRSYLIGSNPVAAVSTYFASRPTPRLAVIEHANIDGRRRLLLVRRDDVEHLIMTGGPVDVVVETGIQSPPVATAPGARATTADAAGPTVRRAASVRTASGGET